MAVDDTLAGLGGAGGLVLALLVGILIGLRHASDPDHLTAVSMLVMSERGGKRVARRLGLSWGLGHATALVALGMPVVLVSAWLPQAAQRAAELVIALVIVALAARLLVRWRRGYFHVHVHRHGDVVHSHPHVHLLHGPDRHAEAHEVAHEHRHGEALGRSPAAAYAIGAVHGVGGSAGAAVLLIGALPGAIDAAAALIVFAAASAISMALLSTALAAALGRRALATRFEALAPVLGAFGLGFGLLYGLAAVEAVPTGL